MMKNASIDSPRLILSMALILGTIVRFMPTLMAGFPLNDGGMFLSMIRDLRASGYILPTTTTYNFSDIPYAYPPLGFYLARILADLGFDELALLQFIPALATSIAIYGFYLFVGVLTNSDRISAWSALVFALTPRSFAWLVMGGGLTRALGYCFFLFTIWSVCHLFRNSTGRWLIVSVLFATLTVLSHPESAIQAASTCILMWLFFEHTRRSAIHSVAVALTTLLLTLPWWGVVLIHHGLDPFKSALNTGLHGADVFARFWLAIFPDDSLLPIQAVVFLVALGRGVWKRDYFLLSWMVVPFLIEPRSGIYVVLFPLSILTAVLLADISDSFNRGQMANRGRLVYSSVLLLFVCYLFAEGYLFGFRLVNNSLSQADRATLTWVHENTPLDSNFALLTGISAPELDAFQEWFPVLAERKSLTTFQGTEWTLGNRFAENLRELRSLQACASAECVRTWMNQDQLAADFILVRKRTVSNALLESLKTDDGFEIKFEDETIVLFELR